MKWKLLSLGEHVDILSGFAFKSEKFNTDSSGTPLVRIRDVVPGITSTHYNGPYDDQFVINEGDILIGMDGEFNCAKWRGGPSVLNQRVCRITCKNSVLDEGYLFRFLPNALKKIEDRTPFATVKHLSVKDIRTIKVPLPPLGEQRRIAAILDQADDLRRKRREACRKTDELARTIYRDNFGDPVANPLSHPTTTLGALGVQMEYGPRFYNEAYSEDGTRIVRITDLSETGELNFDAMPRLSVSKEDLERHKSRPDELLFARTGATVGKLALISSENPICIPGAYFIRLRFPTEVDPTFAWYTLRSNSIQDIIFEGSRQSAQQNFSGPGLRRLPFIIPPLAAQRAFAARVAEIDKLKARHRAHLTKLDALFTSLQHRAFRGEL